MRKPNKSDRVQVSSDMFISSANKGDAGQTLKLVFATIQVCVRSTPWLCGPSDWSHVAPP